VPAALAKAHPGAPYNDLAAGARAFASGDEIACIIVEPVAGNMNCIAPRPASWRACARCARARRGADLRRGDDRLPRRPGRRAGHYGITPDLTTLGKVIGGGMPVGAFGGKREIMEKIAPLGPVYQAGTLSGNPVAMAAGLATLELIRQPGFRPWPVRQVERFKPLLPRHAAAKASTWRRPPSRPASSPPPTVGINSVYDRYHIEFERLVLSENEPSATYKFSGLPERQFLLGLRVDEQKLGGDPTVEACLKNEYGEEVFRVNRPLSEWRQSDGLYYILGDRKLTIVDGKQVYMAITSTRDHAWGSGFDARKEGKYILTIRVVQGSLEFQPLFISPG
jgi:hypothetical protein